MPKNKKGFRWVQITDEQYQNAIELSESYESISFVVNWSIRQMMLIPQNLPKRYAALPFEKQKQILEIINS